MVGRVFLLAVVLVNLSRFIPVHAGTTPLNNDYFMAEQEPRMKELLHLVEMNHINRTQFHSQGVIGMIRAGQYDQSMRELAYALERFPNHPKALTLMGLLAKMTKKPLVALTWYERATKLYPQYALTHAQYGWYLVDIGNVKKGTEKLIKAIELDPQLAAAHAWLATAYYKTGNVERARQAAERARELGYKGKISGGVS